MPGGGPVTRDVVVRGGRTGMRLEAELWGALDEVCRCEGIGVDEPVRRAEECARAGGRTDAVRADLVGYFRRVPRGAG